MCQQGHHSERSPWQAGVAVSHLHTLVANPRPERILPIRGIRTVTREPSAGTPVNELWDANRDAPLTSQQLPG
jgi:hypothetical protein